jgi:hypothetical protein
MRNRFNLLFSLALVIVPNGARAADWYTGAEPQQADKSWLVAVDTSASVTSNSSAFGSVTATAAVNGDLARDGVRVRVEGVAGTYSYPGTSGATVRGFQEEGSALAGYELVWKDAALAGFVGLNVRNNSLSIIDPNNPVVGTSVGVKGELAFYATPTDNTFVSAIGSYSSNFNAYYSRFRFGILAADGVYVGPEALFLGDDFFRQYRIGAHVTGLKLGPISVSASAGYVSDRVQGSGYYTSLEARTLF